MFSETVIKHLGNYVYRLIDPRNGETFYVGQGKGNRIFDHVASTLKLSKGEDKVSAKYERIRDIKNSGLQVQHVIHRHGISKDSLSDVEAALIDAYPNLTNIAGGHGSNVYGIRHSTEIISLYDLPKLSPPKNDKLILINVNRSIEDTSKLTLYSQVRFAWRISKKNAKQADYIIAVVRGVVKGVFVAEKWLPATKENFPEFEISESDNGRLGFVGHEASTEIQKKYFGNKGKRIVDPGMKHIQNPIRYWNIS